MNKQELTHCHCYKKVTEISSPPYRKYDLASGPGACSYCDPLKIIIAVICLYLPVLTYGEEQTIKPQTVDTSISMEALARLIEEQRGLLEQQDRQMDEQDRKLQEQEIQLEKQRKEIEQQRESLEDHVSVLNSLQTQLDQLAMNQGELSSASEKDKAVLTRLQVLEEQLATIPEDPTLSRDNDEVRPGSIALPGTNASLRIGGYVKLALIKTFDPLGSVDRFIVGSIPVTSDNTVSFDESSMSSSQSRLNLDLNSKTGMGNIRAFVEGDFAGEGDTFRLRHAYGQFRDLLAGKTWSVFYDAEAAPEELDFEGINGQVNVRQSQIRYFPAIGKSWDLSVAIEDPNAEISTINFETGEISDAEGVSIQPDLTLSIRKSLRRFSHLKLSVVLRQISARSEVLDHTETEFAWGLNLSGVLPVPMIHENDNLKWQLIYGEGIGRYVNDLNTLGGLDGVFDAEGKIRTLPVLAGYIAYQHWWTDSVRSSLLYSGVQIDNYSFQPDDSYYKTERLTWNVVYSTVARFNVGIELLWGRRTNKDRQDGEAFQLQLTSQFRF